MTTGPRGWANDVPPEMRELAERALDGKPDQLQALQLVSHGLGAKRIGLLLGVDESSIRGRLRRARLNVKREMAAQRGIA